MLLVKYNNGKTERGVLLALGDQMVRIAIEGSDDAVVFLYMRGVWVSEDCEVVRFEFAENGFPIQDTIDFREAVFPTPRVASAVSRVM
jgi:hypothetical protein